MYQERVEVMRKCVWVDIGARKIDVDAVKRKGGAGVKVGSPDFYSKKRAK